MPLLGSKEPLFVSFSLLNEERALRNHSQSLEALASRGGLSTEEMVLCAVDLPLKDMNSLSRSYYTSTINYLLVRSNEHVYG